MLGPGKYDELCTEIMAKTGATGCVVIIVGGELGNGFSVQGPPALTMDLPRILRYMADQIQKDFGG